jgi:hypothetical protein
MENLNIFIVELLILFIVCIVLSKIIFYLFYRLFDKQIRFRDSFKKLFIYQLTTALILFLPNRTVSGMWLYLELIIVVAVLFYLFYNLVCKKSLNLKKSLLLFFLTVLIIFPITSFIFNEVAYRITPIENMHLETILNCSLDFWGTAKYSPDCRDILFVGKTTSFLSDFFYSPFEIIQRIALTRV